MLAVRNSAYNTYAISDIGRVFFIAAFMPSRKLVNVRTERRIVTRIDRLYLLDTAPIGRLYLLPWPVRDVQKAYSMITYY